MAANAPVGNAGQPASPSPADMQMSAAQVRDLFLQTALYSSLPMDPITWSTGNTITIKVPQTGVAHKIRLEVTLSITASAAVTTVNQRAPYSFITNIVYVDPSGVQRVNCSAYELALLDIVKDITYDPSNGSLPAWTTNATLASVVWNNPTPGTSASTVSFFVDIPISMSARDTRGSILLESATSPSFIQVQMANTIIAASGIEQPYTGAQTISALSGTIQPRYYFWVPTYVNYGGKKVLPLPSTDFQVIHEVIGLRNSAALNSASDNRVTLPSGRSYYRVIAQLVNNGAFVGATTGDVNGVKFQLDQRTTTLNESLQGYLSRTRQALNRDLPLGVFLWDLTDRPYDASHYGQLDAILNLGSNALTSPYVQVLREGLYQAPPA